MPPLVQGARYVLRIALAFALIYAAIGSFHDPVSWVGYLPGFTGEFIDPTYALHIWSGIEILLALWILSGWRVVWPAGLTALALFLMVVFNWNQMPILFRDVSLGCASAALALLEVHGGKKTHEWTNER